MSVERQFNWLGQQRVDVPHLRTIDSSNANDFDVLAGQALSGGAAVVVTGFVLITSGAIGQPATSLQLQTDPGLIFHYNASENGTIFQTQAGTAPEVLSSTNPRVQGSFTASQLNYVGIDLLRSSDPTTSDLVEFLDADTLEEEPETVPLARTLNYVIIISTTDFTSQTNVLPIALVTTDSTNSVVSIQDARQGAFRLGAGGTIPNKYNAYSWPQGRNEVVNPDGFSGGDKAFTSLRDAIQGIESRLQELGGGPYWYSPTSDRQVKFIRNLYTRFSNGDNFKVDGSGNLLWQGLGFVFCNATDQAGVPLFENLINDQVTEVAGLTDIQIGECIYVDVNEQPVAGLTAPVSLQPVKTQMATVGWPSPPYTRWVIAWRTAYGYFTRDSQFGVGTLLAPASTLSNGVVTLNQTPFSATNPVVVVANSAGAAIATGLSRGNGSAPDFGTGTLTVGGGSSDQIVIVGNQSNFFQFMYLGNYNNVGFDHQTFMDGNYINIGNLSPGNTQITIGNNTGSDELSIETQYLVIGPNPGIANSNLWIYSEQTEPQGTVLIYSNNVGASAPTGNVVIGDNNVVRWDGYVSIGAANVGSLTPTANGFSLLNMSGGYYQDGEHSVYGSAGQFKAVNLNNLIMAVETTGSTLASVDIEADCSTAGATGGGSINLATTTTNGQAQAALTALAYTADNSTSGQAITFLISLAESYVSEFGANITSGPAYMNVAARSTGTAISQVNLYAQSLPLNPFSTPTYGEVTVNLGANYTYDTLPTGSSGSSTVNIYTSSGNPIFGSINLLTFGGTINIGNESFADQVFIGPIAATSGSSVAINGDSVTVGTPGHSTDLFGATVTLDTSTIEIGQAFIPTHIIDETDFTLTYHSPSPGGSGTFWTSLDSGGLGIAGANITNAKCTDLSGTATIVWSGSAFGISGQQAFFSVRFARAYPSGPIPPKVVFSYGLGSGDWTGTYITVNNTNANGFDVSFLPVNGTSSTIPGNSVVVVNYLVIG
jgi:hypothetical protein